MNSNEEEKSPGWINWALELMNKSSAFGLLTWLVTFLTFIAYLLASPLKSQMQDYSAAAGEFPLAKQDIKRLQEDIKEVREEQKIQRNIIVDTRIGVNTTQTEVKSLKDDFKVIMRKLNVR